VEDDKGKEVHPGADKYHPLHAGVAQNGGDFSQGCCKETGAFERRGIREQAKPKHR
jgi:hypothetical protein